MKHKKSISRQSMTPSPEEEKLCLSSLSMLPNEAPFRHASNQNPLNEFIKLSFVSIIAPFSIRIEIVS
jgi:hypothetical protein